MSTTNYPAAQPLIDPNGKVAFPITRADYVLDAVKASDPVLKGSLKFGSITAFTFNGTTLSPLPVAYGGTGMAANPSMTVNLGSGNAANVFQATPQPGVTGTLPVNKGGTGATSATAALAALGGVSAVRYTATVPGSSWTTITGGYSKVVSISGIQASDVPIVGVVLSDTASTAKTQLTAAGCVNRITTSANNITCYAYNSAPTTNFDIQLLCIRGFTG